jgi:hypothetical protein
MKYLFLFLLLLIGTPAYADVNYQVYRAGGATPCFGCGQALNSGTTTNINYNWGGGIVMNSGLYDGVQVHFTGYITVPGTGSQTITFYDYADDGFILNVNGSRVISNWREQGPGYWNGQGSITLQGGQTYAFDVWYYENGGGAAVQMYWNQSGSIALLPNASYGTSMPVDPKKFGDGGTSLASTSINSTQQTKINQTNGLGHNSIYINNTGDFNSYNIEQKSDYNVIRGINGNTEMLVNGSYNHVTITQGTSTTIVGQNLAEVSIIGSNNSLNLTQQYDSKYSEIKVNGANNNMTIEQKDTGNKSTFVNIASSNNTVSLLQQGSGNHFADINIPNGGSNVSISQSGSAQKLFSLILNNSNIGVTIIQDNPNISDSAAMSITCTVGPCTGYTYTKH